MHKNLTGISVRLADFRHHWFELLAKRHGIAFAFCEPINWTPKHKPEIASIGGRLGSHATPICFREVLP